MTINLKKLAPFISLLLIITSCKNDVKPLTFKNEVISSSFAANIEIAFDKVEGNSDIAKAINTSLQNEFIKAIPNSENFTTLDEALKSFDNQYKTFTSDFNEESKPWDLIIETEIVYQSDNVITIVLSSYSDTGGAHGNDSISLLNFNPKTGTLYKLSDLVNDMAAFKTLAESYFVKNLNSENLTLSEFFFGESFQLPENIGFSDDGLIMLYNVYEIAAYDQGYTEFVIPFEAASAFLKIN